jgi:hypothetical protein
VTIRGQETVRGHVRLRTASVRFDHVDGVLEILLCDLAFNREPVDEIAEEAGYPFDVRRFAPDGDLVSPRDEFDRKLALHNPKIVIVLSEQKTRIGCPKGDFGLDRAVVWTRSSTLR